jgi:signal transduction histidine kinase
MSIRTRLIATSLVTLAVGLGALIVIGNVLLAVRTAADTTNLLEGRANAQIAALEVTSGGLRERDPPNDAILDRQSWVLEGDVVKARPAGVSPELDRAAVSLGRSHRSAERGGPNDFQLLTRPVYAEGSRRAAGSVVVGASTEPFDRLRDEVLVGSVVLAALVLLAGWLAIRSAVDGALGPVARMTEDAESWGAHDLDRRFDLGPPTDELSGLAATLDRLLARIAASRRHEQRFASDVAHELRTPVTALQARTELALGAKGKGAEAERKAALRAVADDTKRLEATIDSLLAVARSEIDASSGSVSLLEIAREIADVEVSAPENLPEAEGDPEIARRALAPLVENAQRHARKSVRLELSASHGVVRVEVHDDGPGVDPGMATRIFEPGVRGDDASQDGAGLGLALSRRLARACGGDVTVEPGDHGCFVLRLPAV